MTWLPTDAGWTGLPFWSRLVDLWSFKNEAHCSRFSPKHKSSRCLLYNGHRILQSPSTLFLCWKSDLSSGWCSWISRFTARIVQFSLMAAAFLLPLASTFFKSLDISKSFSCAIQPLSSGLFKFRNRSYLRWDTFFLDTMRYSHIRFRNSIE